MSALFGAATILAMFLWALALFEEIKPALWTAALTALNQIIYVQARIAMLDVFMFAFLTFGLAAFTYAMKTSSRLRANLAIVAMGIFFGLAGACKISGFFTLVGLAPLAIFVYAAKRRRQNDPGPGAPDFGAEIAARRWSSRLGSSSRRRSLTHAPICRRRSATARYISSSTRKMRCFRSCSAIRRAIRMRACGIRGPRSGARSGICSTSRRG